MPIRPENIKRYPANWPDIRARIRERSGNRCECTGQCGVDHGSRCERTHHEIGRYYGREWFQLCRNLSDADMEELAGALDMDGAVRIVLTVAHLNHTPEDCRDENLLHMCQGCHNRYDAPVRRAGIQARARAQRAAGDLFTCTEVTS